MLLHNSAGVLKTESTSVFNIYHISLFSTANSIPFITPTSS